MQPVKTARLRARVKGSGRPGVIIGGGVVTPAPAHAIRASLSYDAASTKRRANAWGGHNGGPNVVLGNAETLRARVRDGIRNIGVLDASAAVIEANTVGTGIRPQFATPDEGLNKDLAALWQAWVAEADPAGQMNFYGMQALAVRETVEAGEVFGRLRVRRRGDGLAVPLQVQLLEAEHCPVSKNEAYGGNTIVGGIERTPFGATAAYWMYATHPHDTVTSGFRDGRPQRVPADQMFHMMEMRRAGQVRGEPWLVRALILALETNGYLDAEAVRKRVAALTVGVRKRPHPDHIDPELFKRLYGNDSVEDDEVHASLAPGAILELEAGEDMSFNSPADVGGNFEAYLKAMNRAIAASSSVLYEQITGDYSNLNDRTLRAAANEFRRRCMMRQHLLVAFQMCRPVHAAWINLAVLSGAIRPPAGLSREALMQVRWMAQGWDYIHPLQDIQARILENRAGLASRKGTAARKGDDIEAIDAEIAADNARADRLGHSFDSDGRRAQSDPTKIMNSETEGTDDA
jgi:lambda family phage portal protein